MSLWHLEHADGRTATSSREVSDPPPLAFEAEEDEAAFLESWAIKTDAERASAWAAVDYGDDGWSALFQLARSPDAHEKVDKAAGAIVPDMEILRAWKWADAKSKRDQVRYGGCPTPWGIFDTDPQSQAILTGAVVMARELGDGFLVDWTMKDNVVVQFDASTMAAAGVICGIHAALAHKAGQGLRAAIEACSIPEELDLVDIEAAPWPSNTVYTPPPPPAEEPSE